MHQQTSEAEQIIHLTREQFSALFEAVTLEAYHQALRALKDYGVIAEGMTGRGWSDVERTARQSAQQAWTLAQGVLSDGPGLDVGDEE